MTVRVALIQMVSSKMVPKSLSSAQRLIEDVLPERPDAIFLPENFAALAADSPLNVATGEADAIRQFVADVARESGAWTFGGTLPLAYRPDGIRVPGDRVRAASLVCDPAGREVARYDKIHMFDVDVSDTQGRYRESDTFEAGEQVVDVMTPFGRVGLSVCYDIRFPELYRELFQREVEFVTIPSAFTEVTGEAHFELLMRARAVENSCFTIAACQGGVHDSGRRTWGHSMVVSPWGKILGELGRGEDVLVLDLETDELADLRSRMPFRQQRRL